MERGRLVTLGERGIVENGVNEVDNLALEPEDCVADVQEFRGIFPEDMRPQQFQGFAMEEDFEAVRFVRRAC
jgi:hypothetical protein